MRTPLARQTLRWLQASSDRPLSRRRLLAGAAVGAASLVAGRALGAAPAPRIAIVGAGIAGLNAAWTLKKAGVRATVYEAADRTGGRMFTDFNAFGTGITTEIGGEFIDSSHQTMLDLAAEFGLSLIDTQTPSEANLAETYFFGGRSRSHAEVVKAFAPVAKRIAKHQEKLVFNDYSDYNALALRLDRTPLNEYLRQVGADGWLYDLLDVAYETEYGLATSRQSALNFLLLVGTDPGTFSEFGESDQRYKIAGGNQLLVDAMAAEMADQIHTGHELIAARRTSRGIRLVFRTGATVREAVADIVLLTAPFTTLRRVDLDLGLPRRAMRGIHEITYGTNSKLVLGYDSRAWRDHGQSGLFFSDLGSQSGWDSTQLQPGTAGAVTVFFGGARGVELGSGSLAGHASRSRQDLAKVFPGSSNVANTKAKRYVWPEAPFALGSYTCFAPGQYTEFGGYYNQAFGNVYFAGEHCSLDAQGYMEGGAATGADAANAILTRFGL